MAVKGSLPAVGVIVPHLVVRDSAEAANSYTRAFAAKILYRSKSPSGKGEHVHLKVWASLVQISSEEPNQDQHVSNVLASPETLGGQPVCSKLACPMLMLLITALWKAGLRPRCHRPTCFGVIDMPGSAIHLAICGLFVRRGKS